MGTPLEAGILVPPFGVGSKFTVTQLPGEGTHTGSIKMSFDLAATMGTPLYSPTDGKVIAVKDDEMDGVEHPKPGESHGLGNFITIEDQKGDDLRLNHLKEGSVPFKVGDTVQFGEKVGEIGRTGERTGDHVQATVAHNQNMDSSNDDLNSVHLFVDGGGRVGQTYAGEIAQPIHTGPFGPTVSVQGVVPENGTVVVVVDVPAGQHTVSVVPEGQDTLENPFLFATSLDSPPHAVPLQQTEDALGHELWTFDVPVDSAIALGITSTTGDGGGFHTGLYPSGDFT